MAKFFGTNGIRGIFCKDLTLEFLHDMTLAIGTFFKEGTIIVANDGRDSSPIIAKIVCSAINYLGLNCNYVGLVPTPCLEYSVKKFGYTGGIMITASHNPPEYNGIKPAAKDGVEISREDELIIESIFLENNFLSNPQNWGLTGNETRAIEAYINGIISQIEEKKIKEKNLKVVLDLGNGAQVVCAPQLCNRLNCKIFLVNETIDGLFSGRGSEPTPENLSTLSKSVIQNRADLGIAFDGDGDRSIFCDNQGRILNGDVSAQVLTNYILKKIPNSLVVTCMNSSSNIEIIAKKFCSKVIRTKVGSVEVSRKMVENNALIGFEENGGFMYGKHNQVRDGCMTLALMLELLANSNKSLSEEVSNLPPSFTTKEKITCSREDAQKLVAKLADEFPDSDTTDGIKIVNTNNWIMIRPSGTEPILRIYGEAENQEELNLLMSKNIQKVKSLISDNTFKTNPSHDGNGE